MNTELTDQRAPVATLRDDFEMGLGLGPEPETAQPATVRVDDIVLRDDWQVRDKLNEHLVREYATHYVHGADMPPIRLANVDGALILMDGWHRLLAQQKLGREEVEARIEQLSDDEAQFQAALANTRNGARLTRRSEKRRVFELYMRQERYRIGARGLKSYRQIAKDLEGIGAKSTIENWMKQSFPKIAAKMQLGRDKGNGGVEDPKTRLSPAEWRIREALKAAAAEAKGVPCLGKRMALVREFSKAVLGATPWLAAPSEAIENNTDF